MLKWPNDVMLLGKKLAGILLERERRPRRRGFRCQSRQRTNRPGPAGCRRLSGKVTPQAFAPLLAGSFARLIGLWRQSDPASIAQAWLARAHPVGTELQVHANADETISGRFDGIEPDGALRLRREDGLLDIVRAGDVEL